MSRTKTRAATRRKTATLNSNGTPPAALEVFTLGEAAAYLRVAEEDVLRMISTQGLPGRRFGSEWRFLKSALQDWLRTPPEKAGLLSQLGKAQDDPYLEEMLADIYARRGRPETAEE